MSKKNDVEELEISIPKKATINLHGTNVTIKKNKRLSDAFSDGYKILRYKPNLPDKSLKQYPFKTIVIFIYAPNYSYEETIYLSK